MVQEHSDLFKRLVGLEGKLEVGDVRGGVRGGTDEEGDC